VVLIGWRWQLTRDINDHLGTLRAAGLPASGEELNGWYPTVPDAENAALVMTQAFALLQTYPAGRSNEIVRMKLPPHGQSLTSEQRELLTGYVDMNSEAIAKASEAVTQPRSRYPVDFAPAERTLLPHLSRLRDLARLNKFRGVLAFDSDRADQGVTSITDVLDLARTLDMEPNVISQLVRISIITMAKETLERGLTKTAFEQWQLDEVAERLAAADNTNFLVRALIGERATDITTIERFRLKAGWHWWGLLFACDECYYLDVMESNIRLAGLAPPGCLAAADGFAKTECETKFRLNFFPSLFLPSMSNVVVKMVTASAYERTAVTALGIERFRLANGRSPEKLEEIVPEFLPALPNDPFDGKPMRFRRLAKGYVVYSIGNDRHDDGGREKPLKPKSADATNYDLTFTVER